MIQTNENVRFRCLAGSSRSGPRNDALDDEGPQQDGHGDAARDAERNGRNQGAAFLGIVGRAWAEDTLDGALAESALVSRRALHRVRIGHPLGRPPAESRDEADVGADGATGQYQLPVPEGIRDTLHDAAQLSGGLTRDARPLHRQVDDLGNGEQAHRHRHKGQAVPQEKRGILPDEGIEGKPRHALDGIQTDGGQDESEGAGAQPLEHVAAAQRRHEGDPQKRQHEEFRGADGKHQRLDDGDGQGQGEGAEDGAHQRAHERGSQGAAGFPLLRHGMAVDDGGGGDALARNAEEDRRDIPGGGGNRVGAEKKRKRRGGVHVVDERQHQGEGRGASESGQEAHNETDGNADQHEQERIIPRGRKRQDADQAGVECGKIVHTVDLWTSGVRTNGKALTPGKGRLAVTS